MDSKESILYEVLLIVTTVFLLVVAAFVITISRYRKKSLDEYVRKVRTDLSTIENDRKRTASNLHDGIGSYLTAIRLLTDEVLEKVNADDTLIKQIDVAFQKTLFSLRCILTSMIPRTLQREGLLAAIEEQVTLLFPDKSVSIRVEATINLMTIREDAQIHIYRILQELLNNIQKHAEATQVIITFQKKDRFLYIEVRDNGKGFDQTRTAKVSTGFGLTNISDRILLLHGEKYLELVS